MQYDPGTGVESGSFFIKNKRWYMHLYSFTYPLHFGNWGGILIKMMYSFFGIAPALLSITGFIIWRQRQKHKQLLKGRRRLRRRFSENGVTRLTEKDRSNQAPV